MRAGCFPSWARSEFLFLFVYLLDIYPCNRRKRSVFSGWHHAAGLAYLGRRFGKHVVDLKSQPVTKRRRYGGRVE